MLKPAKRANKILRRRRGRDTIADRLRTPTRMHSILLKPKKKKDKKMKVDADLAILIMDL